MLIPGNDSWNSECLSPSHLFIWKPIVFGMHQKPRNWHCRSNVFGWDCSWICIPTLMCQTDFLVFFTWRHTVLHFWCHGSSDRAGVPQSRPFRVCGRSSAGPPGRTHRRSPSKRCCVSYTYRWASLKEAWPQHFTEHIMRQQTWQLFFLDSPVILERAMFSFRSCVSRQMKQVDVAARLKDNQNTICWKMHISVIRLLSGRSNIERGPRPPPPPKYDLVLILSPNKNGPLSICGRVLVAEPLQCRRPGAGDDWWMTCIWWGLDQWRRGLIGPKGAVERGGGGGALPVCVNGCSCRGTVAACGMRSLANLLSVSPLIRG